MVFLSLVALVLGVVAIVAGEGRLDEAGLDDWPGGERLIANDDIPWQDLSDLTELEQSRPFQLKVIVLTMNRNGISRNWENKFFFLIPK